MALSETDLELLMSGYIKEMEKELELYMIIPAGIARIMIIFYPALLYKFGDFNKGQFLLNDEKTILKGLQHWEGTCNGHLVYADLGQYNDIGLNKGVHLWSIECCAAVVSGCFLSIGVTTEKNDKLINEWKNPQNSFDLYADSLALDTSIPGHLHWFDQGFYSYWKGYGHWNQGEVMTIKLNCDDWNVTYYKDGTQVKYDEIEVNKFYYFALLCCDNDAYTHLKIVETQNIQ